MRTLFFALLLTLSFAGSAGAQQQVRTGSLPAATAARGAGRPVPARVVRQAKSTARPLVRGVKAVSGPAARRPLAPCAKAPGAARLTRRTSG